jgi:NgoFVII restriction endonuclease
VRKRSQRKKRLHHVIQKKFSIMSDLININKGKKSKIVQLLTKGASKRLGHVLYLASCYFSPDSAENLIRALQTVVNIINVYIYIDRKTATVIGKTTLEELSSNQNLPEISIFAVDANMLFHTKAYALLSYAKDGSLNKGSLVVGSANLTGAGLTASSGNIESVLDSQDKAILAEFKDQLNKLKTIELNQLENFRTQDSYNFKYALIHEGAFIHKWLDDLGRYLSVRYQLNENGKSKIGDDLFKNVGFNIETATISKRYFDFDYEPAHLENTETLRRRFGIETYLGHWIPNSALDKLLYQKGFDEFCIRLENELAKQLPLIKEKMLADLFHLEENDLIIESENDPFESFEAKVEALLSNKIKLQRIFSKYEVFQLPYDLSQKHEIEEFFDQMQSLCESRKQKNITQKAFISGFKNNSLSEFRQILNLEN